MFKLSQSNPKRLHRLSIAVIFAALTLVPAGLPSLAANTQAPPPIVKDGGFEQGSPNPDWNEFSSEVGTPLCTTADCGFGGGTGPHGGNWWAWFGGQDVPEIGSVTQGVIIPAGTSELSFWLEIPVGSGTGSDFLQVSLDSSLLFKVTDAAAGSYPTYTKIALDVSSFGNCAAHNLSFYSETSGVGLSNFFVDDVVLELTDPATFCDLPPDHWAWQFVEAIFTAGLTAGFPDGTYRPDNPVTRAEMAVFLKKGIHGSTYTPPAPDGSHPFSDISGHWAEAWIEDLFDEGFTSGFPDGTYRPNNQVTRAEMAVFLKKAIHGSAYTSPPPDGSHPFSDISGHWAEAWIEDLYDEGITSGYPDGTYRPENQVTRAEMAVFLVNAFNLPLVDPPVIALFELQTGSPIYIPDERGCEHMGVGGKVYDLQGMPIIGLAVRVSGDVAGVPIGPLNTVTGSAADRFGFGGYYFELSDTPFASEATLLLQVLDASSGLELSEQFAVTTYDSCEANLVFVSWAQVGE